MDLGETEANGEPETLIISSQHIQSHGIHLTLEVREFSKIVSHRVKNSIDSLGKILSGDLADHLEHVPLLGYHVVELMSLCGKYNYILE